MLFLLKGGLFKLGNTIFKAGEKVETNLNLDEMFRGKFEKVNDGQPSEGTSVKTKPSIRVPSKREENNANNVKSSSLKKGVENEESFVVGSRVKVEFEEGSFSGTITDDEDDNNVAVLFDDGAVESVDKKDLEHEDKTLVNTIKLIKKYGKDITKSYPNAIRKGIGVFLKNHWITIIDMADGGILNAQKIREKDVETFLKQNLE